MKGADSMAHIQKFTKDAVGHMCRHFERWHDKEGKYVNFGNQNIDPAKTPMNYNLAPERKNQYGFIMDRCKQVYCLDRKNVNVMCSCIVTAPKDLDEAEFRLFFKATYEFLVARYGGKDAENVVSAYVHMDEGRAHIHFAWVPVAYDEEKERWAVNAKKVVDRQDLRTLHKDLEKHLERELGHDVGILTGELSTRPNLSMPQYQALQDAQKQLQDIERNLAALNAELEPKRVYIGELLRQLTAANETVRERTHLGGRKTVEIDEKRWNEVKMTYADKKASQELYDRALEMIQEFHSSIAGEKYKKVLQEIDELRERLGRILAKNELMAGEIDKVNAVFKKYPVIQDLFFEKLREIENEKSHNDEINFDVLR